VEAAGQHRGIFNAETRIDAAGFLAHTHRIMADVVAVNRREQQHGDRRARCKKTSNISLKKPNSSVSIAIVPTDELCNQKNNHRFAASAAVHYETGISLNGHIRGTPTSGVPENVPLRARQCL